MDVNSDEWRSKLNYVRRKWPVKEDVVISGMSGRFPKSENVQEFAENLFNGTDMTSPGHDRYPADMQGYPLSCGMVQNLGKFDAELFGIPKKDAHFMDPQLRKLLEVSFEAIIDAGIAVEELKGSNTGVFCGFCFKETDMAFHQDPLNLPLYQQNYQTTVSNAFGLKGPVGNFDTACGSSFAAINEAFVTLKSGLCDRAIVAGYNISLVPLVSLQFRDLQMVSTSGKSKSLDESADGYGRGEAVSCVVLQLKSEAKRIYSTIVNCRSNSDGYKEQGITFPSVFLQRQLMAETYDEVGIDPTTIEYVEAHTTGTQVGDPIELKAIYDVFCYQRSADNPLKIGSLKSNMGHAEGASGLCAMVKANIVFQTGYIPPNIHFKKPNPRIEGLMNGKLVPILEKTPFEGDYISLNCFGFGGSNAHVILKGPKNESLHKSQETMTQIPRLIPICGRTSESVQKIQKFLKNNQDSLTNEFFNLLNQFSKTPSMPHKRYTLISKRQDDLSFEDYMPQNHSSDCSNVWVIIPSNQIKFDPIFKKIPIFMGTLDRLTEHVKCLGIDLSQLLFSDSKTGSTREKTVAIVASQLIMINLMRDIKMPINGFIGNSLGQLAYAFAKSLITEERAINAAYWLGHLIDCEGSSSKETGIESNHNGLAEKIADKCQTDDQYRNICGSTIQMKFNGGMQLKLPSNIHDLLEFSENYAHQMQNSQRQNSLKSSLGSGPFLTQINRELLNQVINSLPRDSIVLNFDSQIVNLHLRSVQFVDYDHLDINGFLKSIGKLYTMDLPVDISCLYPKVDYPVPINTPSLHSLVDLDHTQDYSVFKYPDYYNFLQKRSSFLHIVALGQAEDWFFSDHKIDGRILFPATGMLMQVWHVVIKFYDKDVRRSKVLFRDVSFIRATVLSDKPVKFRVNYAPHNNSFILSESDSPIAMGKIFVIDNIEDAKENYKFIDKQDDPKSQKQGECHDLSKEDIYKELRNRGYDYGPSFRCLTEADQYGRSGKVEWREVSQLSLKSGSIFEKIFEPELSFLKTWTTYSDSVLQLALLANRFNRSLFVPTGIETLLVDAEKIISNVNAFNERELWRKSQLLEKEKQESSEKQSEENTEEQGKDESKKDEESEKKPEKSPVIFDVLHDPITRTIITDGMWIRGLKATLAPRRTQRVQIETQNFVPFNEPAVLESKYQDQLKSYIETCEKYASLVTSEKDLDDEPLMKPDVLEKLKQNFDFKEDPSFGLLNYLISMLEKNENEVDISKTSQDILIGKDSKYSLLKRFLEPFFDTCIHELAYSGQSNPSINIIEQNDGKSDYVDIMRSTIDYQAQGIFKISYTFASSQPDPEVKEKISGRAFLITWDAESPLDGDVTRADFLIYKNYSSNISSTRSKIENLIQAIKPDGFLFVITREKVIENIEKICSIPQVQSVVTELKSYCMGGENIINLMGEMDWICVSDRLLDPKLSPIRGLLFRKKPDLSHEPKIIHVSPFDYQWVETLKTAYNEEDKTAPIWLIGEPGYDQGVVGLTKCLGLEPSGDRLTCIANRYHDRGIDFTNISLEDPIMKQILDKKLKFNIYDPDCGWGDYIHMEVEEKHEKDPRCFTEALDNVRLEIVQPGDLSSLRWCKSTPIKPTDTKSVANICYAPLNFKDVLLSSARLPLVFEPSARVIQQDSMSVKIGFEYSGYDENGNRVMGMTSSGAMSTQVPVDKTDFVWPVPAEWSLEDAATVPVVYGTVIYGLIMRGNLKQGESVLIHAGSGGVGIAAIHLCLSYKCTIYTTVGTPEKRKFILDRFPQLTEANIGNSRDTSFEEMILRETGGRGVDIVLNSLADDKLQASIRCLAPGGRFIEIGKYDGFKNSPIELGWLDNGRSFHGVMLDSFFNPAKSEMEIVTAQKERLGELLNKLLKNGAIKPLPRTVFEMERAEDAFRYMAAGKHVGKVVIKIRDPEHLERPLSVSALKMIKFDPHKVYIIIGGFGGLGLEIALWMATNGAQNIVINSRKGPQTSYHQYCLDRLAENHVDSVISTHDLTTEEGTRELFTSLFLPVGGIFNSALVLDDALFTDQSEETFAKVCVSKINITHNLDKISREMCPHLNYFVVFSSIASGRGNQGQSNYGFANSFMENLCERRRRDGLHGLAVQWGFIGDVGYVVEKLSSDVQSVRGTDAQRLPSVLATLERVLNYPNSTILSMVRSEGIKLESSGDIIKSICHILGIKDIYALDPQITLGELGMDSLMAIEVQQTMDRNFNVSITPKEVRQMKICELIALSKKFDSNEIVRSKLSDLDFDLSEESQFLPEEPTTNLNNCSGELVFALPPIQGHYRAFSGLLERLDQPVVGLNWTHDLAQLTTFEDVASAFADRIVNLTRSSEVGLIAYSYGGVLAREIVRQLEERKSGPKIAKLILLDSDLTSIKKTIAENFGYDASSGSEDVQEQEFIRASMQRFQIDSSQLEEELKKATSKTERFNAAKKYLILNGVEPSRAETLTKINELMHQKFRLLLKYEPQEPNSCKVIHLRAKKGNEELASAQKDANIDSQYFFDGDHNNFINENLDQIRTKVIEFFNE